MIYHSKAKEPETAIRPLIYFGLTLTSGQNKRSNFNVGSHLSAVNHTSKQVVPADSPFEFDPEHQFSKL